MFPRPVISLIIIITVNSEAIYCHLYRLIDTIPKVKFVAVYANIGRGCHF